MTTHYFRRTRNSNLEMSGSGTFNLPWRISYGDQGSLDRANIVSSVTLIYTGMGLSAPTFETLLNYVIVGPGMVISSE